MPGLGSGNFVKGMGRRRSSRHLLDEIAPRCGDALPKWVTFCVIIHFSNELKARRIEN